MSKFRYYITQPHASYLTHYQHDSLHTRKDARKEVTKMKESAFFKALTSAERVFVIFQKDVQNGYTKAIKL